jgi:hypothetical protein
VETPAWPQRLGGGWRVACVGTEALKVHGVSMMLSVLTGWNVQRPFLRYACNAAGAASRASVVSKRSAAVGAATAPGFGEPSGSAVVVLGIGVWVM